MMLRDRWKRMQASQCQSRQSSSLLTINVCIFIFDKMLWIDSWVELKGFEDDNNDNGLEVTNQPLKSIEDLLAEAASDEMLMVKK